MEHDSNIAQDRLVNEIPQTPGLHVFGEAGLLTLFGTPITADEAELRPTTTSDFRLWKYFQFLLTQFKNR